MVVDKVSKFLLETELDPSCICMDTLCAKFTEEMEKGLKGENSSLDMIPTYIGDSSQIKSGESVIVLDAGGTNFRTCIVTFDEELKPVISDFRKVGMPGITKEVSKKEFYSYLANEVERLIDKSDKIGICFSYAAKITKEHDGIPLIFSKEIKAPEVVGTLVVASLLEELASRGYDVKNKKYSLVNDTVATLLAGKAGSAASSGGYIGFILGTGTNTSYIEDNANILKEEGLEKGKQLINVESGGLKIDLPKIALDFIATTKDADSYHFEKMISGAYLGSLGQFVLERACEEGLFTQGFVTRFTSGEKLTTTTMSHYLEMPHNKDYFLVKCVDNNEDDAIALWLIIRAIIERAAKLTAVNLAATVLKTDMGKDPRYPVIINADGTTYYKTEFLNQYTQYYLHEFLELKHNRYVRLVRLDDSPVLGAAIAGLSV